MNYKFIEHKNYEILSHRKIDDYSFTATKSRAMNKLIRHIGFNVKCKIKNLREENLSLRYGDLILNPDSIVSLNSMEKEIIIEVMSRTTYDTDIHEKVEIYRRIGFSEYWLIDNYYKSIKVFNFNSNSIIANDYTNILNSSILGIEINILDIFSSPSKVHQFID